MAKKKILIRPASANSSVYFTTGKGRCENIDTIVAKSKQLTPQEKLERKREQSRQSWRRKREREDDTLRCLATKKACLINSNKLLLQENNNLRQIMSHFRCNQNRRISVEHVTRNNYQLHNFSLLTQLRQRCEAHGGGLRIFGSAPWNQMCLGRGSLAQMHSSVVNQPANNCLSYSLPQLSSSARNTDSVAMSSAFNPGVHRSSAVTQRLSSPLLPTLDQELAKQILLLGEFRRGPAHIMNPSLLRNVGLSAAVIPGQSSKISANIPSVPLVGLVSPSSKTFSSSEYSGTTRSDNPNCEKTAASDQITSVLAANDCCSLKMGAEEDSNAQLVKSKKKFPK